VPIIKCIVSSMSKKTQEHIWIQLNNANLWTHEFEMWRSEGEQWANEHNHMSLKEFFQNNLYHIDQMFLNIYCHVKGIFDHMYEYIVKWSKL
jgi:hypothetical protein